MTEVAENATLEPPHKSLAEALLAFQAEAPKLLKDSEAKAGSFSYKYIDLADVMAAIQELLTTHELAWSALPCFGPNGEPALRYRLMHGPSGECESDVMPLLVQKLDPQGMGSGITYARRYALTAVLNLVADEDDDGKSASQRQQNGRAQQPSAAPAQQTERPASAKQRGMLNARASEAELCPSDFANLILVAAGEEIREFESEDTAQATLNRMLDRLPAKLVNPVLKQIERVKERAEGVAA